MWHKRWGDNGMLSNHFQLHAPFIDPFTLTNLSIAPPFRNVYKLTTCAMRPRKGINKK